MMRRFLHSVTWRRLQAAAIVVALLALALHQTAGGRWHLGNVPLLGGGAGPTTYYVSTSGSDSNPCTLAQPCASLNAFGTSGTGSGPPIPVGGDTIVIEAGTYNLAYTGVTTPTVNNTGLWDVYQFAGSPGNPVTIIGQGSVIIQRANPASDWSQQTRLLTIYAGTATHDITLAHMTFVGMTGRGDYNSADYPGLTANVGAGDIEFLSAPGGGSATDITFSGVTVENEQVGCIKPGVGTTIAYSQLSGCGTTTYAHAVYASAGGVTVTNSVVSQCYGQGLYTDYHADQTEPVTFTNDLVNGCHLAGIFSSDPGTLIDHDAVYNTDGQGIQVGSASGLDATHPITVQRTIIADIGNSLGSQAGIYLASPGYLTIQHDTFFDTGWPIYLTNGSTTGPNIYRNNIYANSPSASTGEVCLAGSGGSTWDYSLYFHNEPYASCDHTSVGAHDVVGAGTPTGVDPLFVSAPYVNPATITSATPLPNLHLQVGSPAIGAGTNDGLGYLDLGAVPYVPSAAPRGAVVRQNRNQPCPPHCH